MRMLMQLQLVHQAIGSHTETKLRGVMLALLASSEQELSSHVLDLWNAMNDVLCLPQPSPFQHLLLFFHTNLFLSICFVFLQLPSAI